MDDDRPTLSYRPAPSTDPPVDAGPVGCGLAAMMTFALVFLVMLLSIFAPKLAAIGRPTSGHGVPMTALGTASVTSVGLGWLAVRLGRDPRSRSFAHGIWIGALTAGAIMAALYFGTD